MKRHALTSDSARRALAVAGIVGCVALALRSDANVLTRFHIMNAANAEDSVIGAIHPRALATVQRGLHSSFGDEGAMPELDGAIGWLNSAPLSHASLRGKVVLVDFWTYTCINSLRPLPYVKSWAAKYKDAGLVVIGVHTPEFSFEKERANVENSVRNLTVTYPVAIDSNYRIWQSFKNQYWPAQYLVDSKGRIRYHHFGEGDYGDIERVIREFLDENGATGLASDSTSVAAVGIEAAPDWTDGRSPETYIGYRQAQNFASPERVHIDGIQVFSAPAKPSLNHWGLSGSWNVNAESAVLQAVPGTIVFRFHSRDLHLVLAPTKDGMRVRFKVRRAVCHTGQEGGIMSIATGASPIQPEPGLFGQTIVVIRASAGIGLETVRRARAGGAKPILAAREPERLEHASRELGAPTPRRSMPPLRAPRAVLRRSAHYDRPRAGYGPRSTLRAAGRIRFRKSTPRR